MIKYYKNESGDLFANPLLTDGLTEVTNPVRADGTLLPAHDGLSDLEVNEDGSYYEFYKADGTPDVDKINTEALLKVITETNNEALKYLTSTDWYITRQIETGVEVPQDIIDARAIARESIIEI